MSAKHHVDVETFYHVDQLLSYIKGKGFEIKIQNSMFLIDKVSFTTLEEVAAYIQGVNKQVEDYYISKHLESES